jgi:AhpD family alkylhydroperoxidase
MARIPYATPETASPRVAELLGRVPDLNVFRLMAVAENVFEPWLRFGGAVLGATALDDRLRELAILRVAQLAEAEYEWVQHVAIARAVGVSDEQVEAISDPAAACFSDAEHAVVRFTESAVREMRVNDGAWAEAAKHLPPAQLVELLIVIGHYMLLARIMRSCDIDLDAALGAEVVEGAKRASER